MVSILFVQTSLGTIEMVYMVPNGNGANINRHHRNGLNKHHWAPYKPFLWCPMTQTPLGITEMVYMVPNGVHSSTIGHHINHFYDAQ